MRIVAEDRTITRMELRKMSQEQYGDLVKAVVDIETQIMAVDAELHADQESFLIEQGSLQKNLWGINLYPEETDDAFIEFDAMINLRPRQGNRSRGVEDPLIRARITAIVRKLVEELP